MAVKQRNKRTKQHTNGNNSAAKLKSKDDTKSITKETDVHDESKSKINSGNLFQNPFFVAGFLTVILMLSVALYLSQVNTSSRVVIVTKVQEEVDQQEKELEEEQEYQHSIDKIDRRSDLSLEEYRKVYDGKWYACNLFIFC